MDKFMENPWVFVTGLVIGSILTLLFLTLSNQNYQIVSASTYDTSHAYVLNTKTGKVRYYFEKYAYGEMVDNYEKERLKNQ